MLYRAAAWVLGRVGELLSPTPPPEPPHPPKYGCTRCGLVSNSKEDWLIRGVECVVSGVTLGTCRLCIAWDIRDPDEEDPDHCDGRCQGEYRADTGTYYRAVWGSSWSFQEEYSCWDIECVERWVENEAEADCHHCGQNVPLLMKTYVDGLVTNTVRLD